MASEKSVNKKDEFSKGDLVTFDDYGKGIPAVVTHTQYGYLFDADQTYYRLEGVKTRLITVTTGVHIFESTYYRAKR